MPNIQVQDLKIYYEVTGDGPPVVLLPGLLGTIESDWRRFIPVLSRNHRAVAVDLRGHGRTGNPDPSSKSKFGDLHMDQLADDLIGLLDHLNIEQTSVLGYSLGGAVGLLAALKQPGRIQSLVMHATKFFWDDSSVQGMLANLDPAIILKKTPRYAETLQKRHNAVYGDDYWQALLNTAARFILTMPEEGPNLKQASKADFPVLVSVGDHDQLVSLEEAVRLYRSLPRGELLVLPATRHAIQSVRLSPALPELLDFLERSGKPKAEGLPSS